MANEATRCTDEQLLSLYGVKPTKVESEHDANEHILNELNTVIAEQERHIRDLQRALWIALHDRGPIEVNNSTPRRLVWLNTGDGGRIVRRG